MKAITLKAFLFFLFGYQLYAQPFQTAFNYSDKQYNAGHGNSFYSLAVTDPVHASGIQENGDLMQAYLVLYRATKDIQYLNKFIIQCKRVQERRDDNIQNITNFIANYSHCNSISSIYPNRMDSKAWSYDFGQDGVYCSNVISNIEWSPTPLYAGKMMFPMAEFVYMVQNEYASELQNLALPMEALGVNQFQNQYGATFDISSGVNQMNTYADFANWLHIRLLESFDFLETNYWKSAPINTICGTTSFGTYSQINPSAQPSINNDINQQCAMGKALVYLYLITNASSSYKPILQQHVQDIATGLWCVLNTTVPMPNNTHTNFNQSNLGFWAWE
jgi:hypothetical protein